VLALGYRQVFQQLDSATFVGWGALLGLAQGVLAVLLLPVFGMLNRNVARRRRAAARPVRARLRRAHAPGPAGRLGGLRHLGRHRPPSLSTLHLLREQIAANRRAYQVTWPSWSPAWPCSDCCHPGPRARGERLGAGLGLAVLVVGLAPGLGERAALRDAGAEAADPGRWPRYHNLVDGLSQAAGLPAPRLYVVRQRRRQRLLGRPRPSEAALVVTRGLLTALNRVELEGVLAHELNHIWSWGARLATLGVALGRVPGLLRLLAPPRREFDADEGGARLTRYPPGLVSALRKLASAASRRTGPACATSGSSLPGTPLTRRLTSGSPPCKSCERPAEADPQGLGGAGQDRAEHGHDEHVGGGQRAQGGLAAGGHGQAGDHDRELAPGHQARCRPASGPAGPTPIRRAAHQPVATLVAAVTRAREAAATATGGWSAGRSGARRTRRTRPRTGRAGG
jgi:hypothetical protein